MEMMESYVKPTKSSTITEDSLHSSSQSFFFILPWFLIYSLECLLIIDYHYSNGFELTSLQTRNVFKNTSFQINALTKIDFHVLVDD